MKVEFILDARELLHMPLLTTFNCFLAEGFREALSAKVVHTLFKGGDASKLFTMILDKRLSKWVEKHGLYAKGQVGFCKYYRSIN
jgi:hypothetical protein